MSRHPQGHGHGDPNHPNYPHPGYPDPNASNSSPGTPSGGLPSPSFPPPNMTTNQNQSNTATAGPSNANHPINQAQQQQSQQSSDRTATAQAASTLLSTFPPYAHTTSAITSLSAKLDSLKARQRIFRRLAHAAVLFSSDHELRYSLLDKCNDLAECMKTNRRLRKEVAKMNEVELQLFSISSTVKQLVQDMEWVRAEDVRGFVEGVRAQMVPQRGIILNGHRNGNGNEEGTQRQIQTQGGQVTGTVQIRLDRGRGDVGRRLNYLMVTTCQSHTQQTQGGGQAVGGGGQAGQAGQGETSMTEGSSRRSSTTATARTTRGQAYPQHQHQQQQQQHQTQQQQSQQAQSYIAAQVAAMGAAHGQPIQPQGQTEDTTTTTTTTSTTSTTSAWSPANASAASSAGRASPGPSEGSSTGLGGHGPNRARWWDTVIMDSDTDQRRTSRSESSRNVRGRGDAGTGSDCEMEM